MVALLPQPSVMKLVILGAGFGGLRLARRLSRHKNMEVTLIDRFNYHQFQPLFYQVATAGLDASNISFPIRKVFQRIPNVQIRLANVLSIDFSKKQVITSTGAVGFDKLVIATGAGTNFFNNPQLEAHAFSMKSTVEALQIRHRLLQNFEDATLAREKNNQTELQRLLNVVIVGAGPTGVELSGAIADMKRFQLPRDFPELDFSQMNIYLLEGTGKTLAAMSEASSRQSLAYLERLGVTVKTNSLLEDYDGQTVRLKDGTSIPSNLVIWAAGIKGNVPAGIDPSLITRGNRIVVNRFCQLSGNPDVYAIGDVAWMEEPDWPNGHPQVAPVAIQQADWIARYIDRAPETWKPFAYKHKGAMATVGRNLAVVDVPRPRWHIGGWLAWLIWMSLHLMLILGVKNRFFVFCNWLYNYFTYDQNLRLIFKEFEKEK